MDMKTYLPLALVTAKLRDKRMNHEHATLGMITEAGEFADAVKKEHVYDKPIDTVNVMEEVGDCLWYAALLAQEEGYDLSRDCRSLVLEDDGEPLPVFTLVTALSGSAVAAAACVDLGHEHLLDLHDFFDLFMGTLQLICDRWNFTMEDAAEVNIAKLKKRYPDGFTTHAALNRDLEGERAVLEEGHGLGVTAEA